MTTANLEQVIADSFTQYAGAVIQSRSLVDVRDFVKPSARQIYYSMYTDNFTYDKPFKKTLKAIGSAMRFYIHGDASCEGIIMRSGQPFTMRYPIVDVEGSYGNLTASENWAAPRYTAARLSNIAEYLLRDTTQHSIDEWVDNYDDTEKYPRVLASKGFYNIVNGSSGIAVGMAASIPQFNLKEVNNAHDARVIVRAYIDRWKIEEVHRAEKVEYQYEDMRVRSLQSLNNLNTILMMFLGFLAKLADSIDTRLLSIKILERSQSLRSELVVYLGMMARGIQDILSYAHTGIQEYKKRRRESKKEIIQEEYIEQLSLTF